MRPDPHETPELVKVGDAVVWLHVPRSGWCLPVRVLAVVEKVTRSRIHIRCRKARTGAFVTRMVKPESLRNPLESEAYAIDGWFFQTGRTRPGARDDE